MPIYKMDGKKDGKQKYRVRVNFIDGAGKPRQTERVTYGMEEAKQLERQMEANIKAETVPSSITLQALFDEYVKVQTMEVRESTLDKSSSILEMHVLPYFKDKRIDKISPGDLQGWKLQIDALTGKDGEKFKPKTKQNIFSNFRALLNYAVKMEYLNKNPLTKIGNFKDTSETKEDMDFYTANEFKAFKAAAHKRAETDETLVSWHFYMFFCIAFYTGLRKGEINALQWGDIQDGFLSVKRSVNQKLKGEDRITPPKNKSSIRTLQLPAPLRADLAAHYERCSKIEGLSDKSLICGGDKPLRDTSIQKRNEAYAKAAGVKTIRIHDFRHSHVSLLANEGINIQEIARRLGHAKIEMTWNTYSHLYPREEERAVQILNEIV